MDLLITAAPWVAVGTLVAACIAVGILAHRTWASWKRVELTMQAAEDLIDRHVGRLDAASVRASEQVGVLADGGELLAAEIAELRSDVDHLRWMLRQVPEQRDRLLREVADLVLPTAARGGRGDA